MDLSERRDGPPRVVVIGFRRGICAALERRGIAFALWNSTSRPNSGAFATHVSPIRRSPQGVRAAAEQLRSDGPFTHVIAAGEAAVVPAARLRRELGARQSPVSSVLRCHDKLAMKEHLAERGIPMTDFRSGRAKATAEQILTELGSPVVVKMRTSSGGRGISFVRDPETLRAIPRRDRLFERFVDAQEASVESFVHRGRIEFTNVTRYLAKGHVNLVPADLSPELEGELLELNRQVIEALRIEWGMTHLEVFLSDDGPLFGEVALRPPGGYIMELLDLAYGGDSWGTFADVELDRSPIFPARAHSACAVVVLHPGAGTVTAVNGLAAVERHPAVVDARIRIHAGDVISPRAGLGQDVGRILLRAPDPSELRAAIEFIERELVIQV